MNKDTHVMLDLETYGTVPGCKLMSIGAAMFKFDGSCEVISTFYTVVNRNEQHILLTEDPDTVAFWEKQNGLAYAEFMKSTANQGLNLLKALGEFSDWIAHAHGIQVWGHGSDFDNAILSKVYDVYQTSRPWGRRASRCYRTIKSLNHGLIPRRVGVLHRADDDAVTQACHLMDIQQKLNLQFEDV